MEIKDIYEIFKQYPRIETDTRQDVTNSIFVALKGDNSDGNKYVDAALEKGAAYAIADDKSLGANKKVILVDDALKALQDLASYHRTILDIPVIAITGSNGKTTTKELLYRVLNCKFNVMATQGNFNNHIGVPLTLLNIKPENKFAVIEMGTNHFGEIVTLCKIAKPNYGLINSIGKAHLEFFGNLDGVAKAKGELFEYLMQNNGTFFMNTDIKEMRELHEKYQQSENICLYNRNKLNVSIKLNSNPYLRFEFDGVEVQTSLIGDYNVDNAMSAIAVGKYFGISDADIATAISGYEPNNNRSELKKTERNILYLDAYNANPTSMQVSLSNFINGAAESKMLVLGDMRELGETALAEHIYIIDIIKKSNIDNVILVGEMFTQAAKETNYNCFANVEACNEYLKNNKICNKTILIKGSHGIHLERIVDFL